MLNRENPAKVLGGIVAFLENWRTVIRLISVVNPMAEVIHDRDSAAERLKVEQLI